MAFETYRTTLEATGTALVQAVQQGIAERGHIKTGRLLQSVQSQIVGEEVPELQVSMFDYGFDLDMRTGFLQPVIDAVVAGHQAVMETALADDFENAIDSLL